MKKDYVASSPAQPDTEFVAGFWDARWKDQQEDIRREQRLRRREEYRFLRQAVPGFEARALDILDCGCGSGEWTVFLRSQGHRVVGIDIAPETITRLRERHGECFQSADFRRIPYEEKSFDVVINWGGIEHFEEGPVPAIQEAKRVLRDGGVYLATTPCHNLRLFLLDTVGLTSGPGYPVGEYRFYQYRFTPSELESYFKASGFEQVRSRIINGAQGVHRSLLHEFGWLGRWLPYLVRGGLMWAGGWLLRPFLGHMVICSGRKEAGKP